MHLALRHRVRLHWLLALLLVFTQQLGVAHLTAHAAQRLSGGDDTGLVSDTLCAKCAVFSSMGSALISVAPIVVPVLAQAERIVTLLPLGAASRFSPFYRSRAPPLSSQF
ncbi:MAG: hypothetical protein QM718_03590 [Steroidobacteraceae bacterium]